MVKRGFAKAYISEDNQYLYGVKGKPTAFLTVGDRGEGKSIQVASPKINIHTALSEMRFARRRNSFIALLLALLILICAVVSIMYTLSNKFMTRDFHEAQFTFVLHGGTNGLTVVDADEVTTAIKEDRDLSGYSYATPIYNGKPSLIGYRLDILTPDVIYVYGGMIFGIGEGDGVINVYSQDGTFLTQRTLIVTAGD
ncbi:MAG TPA: hypothetical protein PKX91_04170 [Clostridia bacterium]|nr:hypothetical protein [Clostridia bacterium]